MWLALVGGFKDSFVGFGDWCVVGLGVGVCIVCLLLGKVLFLCMRGVILMCVGVLLYVCTCVCVRMYARLSNEIF